MNRTVARIVELLFQDVAESAEVSALREELMDNCQERFADLMARGFSEDEAIGAVVESLKGMEEVLAQYPRKAGAEQTRPYGTGQTVVRRIQSELRGWDLEILPATDGRVDVQCHGERADLIDIRFEGDKLVIKEKTDEGNGGFATQESREWKGPEGDMAWSSFSELFRDFGNMFRKAMANVGMAGHGMVNVRIPGDIAVTHTSTSGNLTAEGIGVTELAASTASGDVKMRTTAGVVARVQVNSASGDILVTGRQMQDVTINATSGDVKLEASVDHGRVSTTSGDIIMHGGCGTVEVTTISGDVDMVADGCTMERLNVRTVSGDVDVDATGDSRLNSLTAKTTSGDVSVSLCEGEDSVHASLRSLSGDIDFDKLDAGPNARVKITLESVSGDLSIN